MWSLAVPGWQKGARMRHASWCVSKHDEGACSSKRGHWDRSTNTWIPQMTAEDRRLIAWALVEWREKGRTQTEVLQEVRDRSLAAGGTLSNVDHGALNTWYMTQKRMEKRGRSWPVTA